MSNKTNIASYENNVVHESEKQRQHIRIDIPSIASIGDTDYELIDLSAGGFKVSAPKSAEFLANGAEKQVEIEFKFDTFSFTLSAHAEPVYFDQENQQVGFRFCRLNRQQTSMIHHVIKSYLAGQILSTDTILGVASRDNFMVSKDIKKSGTDAKVRTLQTYLLMGLIAALGLGSLFLLTGNIYESATIVKAYSGVVEGGVFTLRAKGNGTFQSLLKTDEVEVQKDQKIGVFTPQGTNVSDVLGKDAKDDKNTLLSPCDCIVTQHSARTGEFKAMGEALFKLLPKDAEIWVTAVLAPESVHKLKILDDARVKIIGEDDFIEGNVVQFFPQEGEFTKVKIRLKDPISPNLVGRPAYVEMEIY